MERPPRAGPIERQRRPPRRAASTPAAACARSAGGGVGTKNNETARVATAARIEGVSMSRVSSARLKAQAQGSGKTFEIILAGSARAHECIGPRMTSLGLRKPAKIWTGSQSVGQSAGSDIRGCVDLSKDFCGSSANREGTLAASICAGPIQATDSRADVKQVQFWSPPVRNAFRARSALRLALFDPAVWRLRSGFLVLPSTPSDNRRAP